VPTTRRRQGVRSRGAGPAGEHLPKIMAGLVTASVVVVVTLVMTKAGRDIDASTQRFMLYYAGVFALIGLTASVGAGLMATDRIFMTPGHRVMAQSVHRAVSFAALAFLIIHIVTEILAQRVHVIDAVIPFLSPYRTFYIGLGTIASDLILLLIVTSIFRKRFTAHGQVWRWRAIHYASYAAFVLGVLHGLLGGREAKPYVDWSYGFAIALTALALVVRFLAISLRPKASLSASPSGDRAPGSQGSSRLRAAALAMTQAQLGGGTVQVLPPALGSPVTPSWALPPAARDGFAISGPFPAALDPPAAFYGVEASREAYPDPAFMPLGAPAYPNDTGTARQPRYEPGYDGPPRFEGAPRKQVPQDHTYPYGPPSSPADRSTGPLPRAATGPIPRGANGPVPLAGTGPLPRADTGPTRRLGPGPAPRADTEPMPRPVAGPLPRPATGPVPYSGPGPLPRAATGPVRYSGAGPLPRPATGPVPYSGPGPLPRPANGPGHRADPEPRPRTGRAPRPDTPHGPPADPAPRAARRPRRAASPDPADRDVPGPTGGDQWR